MAPQLLTMVPAYLTVEAPRIETAAVARKTNSSHEAPGLVLRLRGNAVIFLAPNMCTITYP